MSGFLFLQSIAEPSRAGNGIEVRIRAPKSDKLQFVVRFNIIDFDKLKFVGLGFIQYH